MQPSIANTQPSKADMQPQVKVPNEVTKKAMKEARDLAKAREKSVKRAAKKEVELHDKAKAQEEDAKKAAKNAERAAKRLEKKPLEAEKAAKKEQKKLRKQVLKALKKSMKKSNTSPKDVAALLTCVCKDSDSDDSLVKAFFTELVTRLQRLY